MYGNPRGVIWVIYMRFGKCMGPKGIIGDLLYEIWEVYKDPRGGVIGCRLYEVCVVYGIQWGL